MAELPKEETFGMPGLFFGALQKKVSPPDGSCWETGS
jgi:hypothetical protein